jgi:ADP-heptose:LPS heptosyltransferase
MTYPRPQCDLSGFVPRRILVCQLRQIGDVLLATPAIRLLKARFPEAEVHVLTEKKCLPVLLNNPDVHTVWPLDKGRLKNPLAALRYYRHVARQGFDLIVDFQQLPRCRWVVFFSDAAVKLTFPPPWYNRWVYTHWTQFEQGYAARSKASVLKPLGIAWNGERPRLYLTGEERAFARDWLEKNGVGPDTPLVTVDPSHRRITRQWPAGHFAQALDLAAEKRPEARFLLLFGPGELPVATAVREAASRKENVLLPPDMLTLRQMAAVIERANLHFGNCSAPRHFAVALDTPSLTVLGATSLAWTFPSPEHRHVDLGLPCQPCNRNSCRLGDIRCLGELAPAVVARRLVAALDRSLDRTRA